MIIANPSYDVLFKYLLEDGDTNDPLVKKIVVEISF
jgi:hypothetical protein